MSESTETYDFCRLFVDGADPAGVAAALLRTGRYQSVDQSLTTDGVWIAVRGNKNIPVDGAAPFLTWPVTIEVDRDDEVADSTMVRTVRGLVDDLRSTGAQVVIAAEFEDEI